MTWRINIDQWSQESYYRSTDSEHCLGWMPYMYIHIHIHIHVNNWMRCIFFNKTNLSCLLTSTTVEQHSPTYKNCIYYNTFSLPVISIRTCPALLQVTFVAFIYLDRKAKEHFNCGDFLRYFTNNKFIVLYSISYI